MASKKRPGRLQRLLGFDQYTYFDYNLLAVVIILICFGLVMLYSASSYEGYIYQQNDMFFFRRQALFFVISIIAALLVSLVNYHFLVRISAAVYVLSIILMGLVLSPLGLELNGSRRWLGNQTFSFQPSEVAKIGLILLLSSMVVNFGKHITARRNFFWLLAAVFIPFLGAYEFTDNLSTALIILTIGMVLLFVYYPKPSHLVAVGLVGLILAVLIFLVKYAKEDPAQAGFRIGRITSWLDRDSGGAGTFQVTQALYAIGSGGFFGKGLGNSTQKFTRVPEAQNDMIFSIICEELGLFGAVLLLVLFGYLLYRLYYIAQNAPDLYGSIIATGIMIHFALQIVLNIAVVSGLLPTTGISLPFVSYGGTAIMFLMGEVGICLNISRQIKIKDA